MCDATTRRNNLSRVSARTKHPMKQPTKPLTPAQQAEDDRELIRAALAIIGSRKTKAKASTARSNGRRGGRPKKEKKG